MEKDIFALDNPPSPPPFPNYLVSNLTTPPQQALNVNSTLIYVEINVVTSANIISTLILSRFVNVDSSIKCHVQNNFVFISWYLKN